MSIPADILGQMEEFQKTGNLPTTLTPGTLKKVADSAARYATNAGVQKVDEYVKMATDAVEKQLAYDTTGYLQTGETSNLRNSLQDFLEKNGSGSPNDLKFFMRVPAEVAQGAGRYVADMSDPAGMDLYPAYELVRLGERMVPRGEEKSAYDTVPGRWTGWGSEDGRWVAACVDSQDLDALEVFHQTGRMVALKVSDVWQSLGDGAGGYEDTLGNPYPPFAFNSGMGLVEIDADEADELGLSPGTGPDSDPEDRVDWSDLFGMGKGDDGAVNSRSRFNLVNLLMARRGNVGHAGRPGQRGGSAPRIIYSEEMAPGKATGVLSQIINSDEKTKEQFHHDMQAALTDKDGNDIIAKAVGFKGVKTGDSFTATGAYINSSGETEFNPTTQINLPNHGKKEPDPKDMKRAETYAAVHGILIRQEAVAGYVPYPTTDPEKGNGIEFHTGSPLKAEEVGRVMAEVKKNYPKEAGGIAYYPTKNGFRLVNYADSIKNPDFIEKMHNVVGHAGLDRDNITSNKFQSYGFYLQNDWNKAQAGEDYQAWLRQAGRPDVLGRVDHLVGRRVNQTWQRWQDKLSGGNISGEGGGTRPGSGRDSSEGSGGSATAGSQRISGAFEKDLVASHWTDRPGLQELDPKFSGTGIPGEEQKRHEKYPDHWVKRIYFGDADYTKEPKLGPFEHVVTLRAGSVYDLNADRDKLWIPSLKKAKEESGWENTALATTIREKEIKKRGYLGYYNQREHAVAVFHKIPGKGTVEWNSLKASFVGHADVPGHRGGSAPRGVVNEPEEKNLGEVPTEEEKGHWSNFALNALAGKNPDQYYADHQAAIDKCAAYLQKKFGPDEGHTIYRGVILDPSEVHDGKFKDVKGINYVSFTDDKSIALAFADPKNPMSEFLMERYPNKKGYLIEQSYNPKDLLYHHSWSKVLPLDLAFGHDADFTRMQKEVMLKPQGEYKVTPVADGVSHGLVVGAKNFTEEWETALEAGGPGSGPRPGVFWHGSPSGEFHAKHYGIHIGTKEAARQALEARIGIRADGKDWDGTQEYGKTLLAGKNSIHRIEKERGVSFLETGYNSDVPDQDHYVTDRKESDRPKYSGGELVDPKSKPDLFPVRITGEMSNTIDHPMSDMRANAQMRGQQVKGNAKRGYFYKNIGEDEGSISAVVPSGEHLQRIKKEEA